jgi:hypothetical protein
MPTTQTLIPNTNSKSFMAASLEALNYERLFSFFIPSRASEARRDRDQRGEASQAIEATELGNRTKNI